ncbi:dicarboxylate/amino acid:cation symporter [Engelhardtia mirabilis]|uniref:Proton glutamate symport protein n=1 Tax=Engelhardtia mirabilis TaxID=2528011 RepID=A0A518BMT9_9BACT|nr:Proton glutamate symport protein [Planctomycetes bacterium Pla133]QDV02582.1 Proton glutamate symport protein [Planctomycetes bacterium Pla86]
MKFHWKVLGAMVLGLLLGLAMQSMLDGPATAGGTWVARPQGLELTSASGPAAGSKLSPMAAGDVFVAASADRNVPRDQWRRFDDGAEPETRRARLDVAVAQLESGQLLWLERADGEVRSIRLELDPDSSLAAWIAPFDFIADIFLRLLKMLIVPLVMSSIIAGVAGVGRMGDLRRLGAKTFAYYISTSLLAIVAGQILVNLFRPGDGAALGLELVNPSTEKIGLVDILRRMVPENVPAAMTDNGMMLQIIFFALLFGYFLTQVGEPHAPRVRGLVDGLFAVMLRMAEGVLKLLPLGVFALLTRVVAQTGFSVFEPLLLYMFTVTLALVIHSAVTLPLLLKFVGRLSPIGWAKAMAPALMTAFSTSSSSMTLPVSMETVEKRGRVSNKITSFTLPLGATINMDGTALYECIGVVFLAQYYASAQGYEFTLASQATVVLLALLASIGAAGIPSAGLVMMLTILAALGLPAEGAALLLAVDRPLDMLRTVVNVWSDSCGAAIIARSEGETGPLQAGT